MVLDTQASEATLLGAQAEAQKSQSAQRLAADGSGDQGQGAAVAQVQIGGRDMSMILNTKQVQQYRADMEELARYRALGMTPERIEALLFPPDANAPLPLDPYGPVDLYGDDKLQFTINPKKGIDDIPVAAGLLEDDGYDPALEAQERYGQDQWDK